MPTKSSTLPSSLEMSYSFGLAGERHLKVDEEYDPLSAWRTLSHHIVRYPRDLRAHTQRVLLGHYNSQIANLLPGSLQDLFLALDNAGYPLRKHLLDLSEQYLTNEEFSFFSQWIKQNAKDDKTQQCWHPGSVLSSGQCVGKSLLLQEDTADTNTGYIGVLEEARACLDYGQLDVALQLLEDEILKSPDSKEIEEELLTIYQYSKNKDQFDKLSEKLLSQGITLSDDWLACQKSSNSWGEK